MMKSAGTEAPRQPRGSKAKKAAAKPDLAAKRAGPDGRQPAATVAVIGGGMAGLTSALRLCKAGFKVTLFEAAEILGGNTSSTLVNDIQHDVYPHMFCGWYDNFWELFENELGLSREANFEARYGVKMLKKGEDKYSTLLNPTSLDAIFANLKSEAMSPAEIFLLSFYGLDLVAHPFDRSGLNQLQQLDVNGFLYSRGYATEAVARMENYILSLIWSIQSEQTAAATYQNFLRHSYKFPDHSPFAWFMKGSMSEKLVAPIQAQLTRLGCDIRLKTEVTELRLIDEQPLVFSRPHGSDEHPKTQTYDYAILALPAERLSGLVMSSGIDRPGKSIVDHAPQLAELQRLSAVSIPVLDLYFKRKLPDIPRDSIGLAGSAYGLTVLDISQLWSDFGPTSNTALVVAASEGSSLPSTSTNEQGWLMIKELTGFIRSFNPGRHWGDPKSDIDWQKTFVRANAKHKLYLNDVGSWPWRPHTCYPDLLPRIAFAGDLVQTDVDMATVEGAVVSGVQAARAVQLADARYGGHGQRGKPIHCVPHTDYSTASFRAAKLFFLPFAYGALLKVAWDEARSRKEPGETAIENNQYLLMDYMLLVPMQFSIDWLKGAYWLARSLIPHDENDGHNASGVHRRNPKAAPEGGTINPDEQAHAPGEPKDKIIGLPTALLMTLGECADYAIEHLTNGRIKEQAAPNADSALPIGNFLAKAIGFAQSLAGAATDASAAPDDRHVRRWRVKH